MRFVWLWLGSVRPQPSAVWAGGAASCPTDGAALRIGWGPAMGGSYALAIHCPRCETDVRMGRAADPLRAAAEAAGQRIAGHFHRHRRGEAALAPRNGAAAVS